ncbi:CAP domain-containing protein [uncultured Paracoccus sp.]|uniref:CAP domain-containing protein n=1 Tax=uncultured Paracoccus sp. TaxID=189685 RepID=UPI002627B446|nr:CAP domain-containing protein [uncultured Paracoccus sp.]
MSDFRAACAVGAILSVLAGCVAGTSDYAKDPYAVQALPPGAATCPATTEAENAVGVAATNGARRAQGLPPVRSDMRLAQVAARHACDMAKRGRMTHIGSSTTGPGPRATAAGYMPLLTAENIAAGPFTLDRVLGEWSRSSGHVANITIPQVRDFGIGHALAADGKTRFWAAVYGAPR